MVGHRNVNVMVGIDTYVALRETSYRFGIPVSQILREGIRLFLERESKKSVK